MKKSNNNHKILIIKIMQTLNNKINNIYKMNKILKLKLLKMKIF